MGWQCPCSRRKACQAVSCCNAILGWLVVALKSEKVFLLSSKRMASADSKKIVIATTVAAELEMIVVDCRRSLATHPSSRYCQGKHHDRQYPSFLVAGALSLDDGYYSANISTEVCRSRKY